MLRFSTIVLAVSALVLCGTGLVNANGLVANWTLNDGGTPGNTLGSGAPITDAAGNGHNGTVGGSSTITSVPGVIGTGLNFGNGSTGEYLDVPKVSDLGGGYAMTISTWVNIPSEITGHDYAVDLPGELLYGTYYSSLSVKGLYIYYNGTGSNYDYGNGKDFWNRTDGSGWAANTWEQMTFLYYGGTAADGDPYIQLYVNGMVVAAGQFGGLQLSGPYKMPTATGNLQIGSYWNGSLNDMGVWNVDLTGPVAPNTLAGGWSEGMEGGEITALYQTPMFNNSPSNFNQTLPLSQYGVSAMDQLFTLYNTQATGTTPITTSNGTLTWKYVASGLGGTSGFPGYKAGSGQYFVQLDSNGGGVETVVSTPEPGVLTLLASGLVGLLAYAWRKTK